MIKSKSIVTKKVIGEELLQTTIPLSLSILEGQEPLEEQLLWGLCGIRLNLNAIRAHEGNQ